MKETYEIHLQIAATLLPRKHMSKDIYINQKRPMKETYERDLRETCS